MHNLVFIVVFFNLAVTAIYLIKPVLLHCFCILSWRIVETLMIERIFGLLCELFEQTLGVSFHIDY